MRPAMATAGPRSGVARGIVARLAGRQPGSAGRVASRGTGGGVHETAGENPVGAAVGAVAALHRGVFPGRDRPDYRYAGGHGEIPAALRQAGAEKVVGVGGRSYMKTPREILLKRHQTVEPKLERMWTENLSPELRSEATPARENVFLAAGWALWRELVLPSRRIWAGLACAWVLIAVLNLASAEPATKAVSQVKPPSGEELRALLE